MSYKKALALALIVSAITAIVIVGVSSFIDSGHKTHAPRPPAVSALSTQEVAQKFMGYSNGKLQGTGVTMPVVGCIRVKVVGKTVTQVASGTDTYACTGYLQDSRGNQQCVGAAVVWPDGASKPTAVGVRNLTASRCHGAPGFNG